MIRLSAIEFQGPAGGKMYVGTIKAKDLCENFVIDYWSRENRNGYQRQLSSHRAKKFKDYLENFDGIFHQTILSNIRNENNVSFRNGVLTINGKIHIIDGQHRVNGLSLFLESSPDRGDDMVPVIFLVGLNSKKEAREFLIVNKTQKGVRSDLADRLIADVVRNMPVGLLDIIGIKDGKSMTKISIKICDKMNRTRGSVWNGRITLPNARSTENETIKQRSFTVSLKPVLTDQFVKQVLGNDPDNLAKVLNTYWDSIGELCPKACRSDPKNYSMLSTAGLFVMHRVFPAVVIACGRDRTKHGMKRVLKKIDEMEDEFWFKGEPRGEMAESTQMGFFNRKADDFCDQLRQ